VGRFMTADPFVGDANDGQEYNRYSYVANNPLGFTDPSGYRKFSDVLKQAFFLGPHILAMPEYWFAPKAFNQYYGQVTGLAIAAVVTYFAGPTVGGMAGGAYSGFAGSLLNGGSIGDAFKAGAIGGAIGAVQGALTNQIGTEFGSVSDDVGKEFGRALAHGVVGGGISEAGGGEFRHGFLAGFAGSAAGSLTPHLGLPGYENRSPSAIASRTIVAAVVGGTVSEIGGGKFVNGAVTSAFQHLFNLEAHLEARLDRRSEAYLRGDITQEELLALHAQDANMALTAASFWFPVGRLFRFAPRVFNWVRRLPLFTRAAESATGIVAQNGTKITGITGHGIERVIGDGARRAGTRPEAILDALKYPRNIIGGVDDAGRPYQIFTGQNARVIVNPQSGKVVSVNPLSGVGANGP